MTYWLSNNKTNFRSPNHARWAKFFESLGIRYDYREESKDGEVDFFLPDYTGGLYVQVQNVENTNTVTRNQLLRSDFPIWAVPPVPDTKVSRVYTLDDFDQINITGVVPGYMHGSDKLFTNPTAVTKSGHIKESSLRKYGSALLNAIEASKNAEVRSAVSEVLEQTTVPQKPDQNPDVYAYRTYQFNVDGNVVRVEVHPDDTDKRLVVIEGMKSIQLPLKLLEDVIKLIHQA